MLVSEHAQAGFTYSTWEFTTQAPIRLSFGVAVRKDFKTVKRVYLEVGRHWKTIQPKNPWRKIEFQRGDAASVQFDPRPLAFDLPAEEQNEIRRRYMLLGQTIDSMRVWDIRRAVAALRSKELFGNTPIVLVGYHKQAINVLYASLFIDDLAGVELIYGFTGKEFPPPPTSHRTSPDYLNVLRFLDIPQAAAMAAERQPVKFEGADPDQWSWTTKTAQRLGWPRDRLQW